MNEQAVTVLNYGGGRQTVAYCVLVAQGKMPRPDRIVIADTGREKSSTWDYLEEITRPLLARVGLEVEIAPRALANVDLYAYNGDLLLPVYTATGKFHAYCSSEWKRHVVARYLSQQGIKPRHVTHLIGFAYDERHRIKSVERRAFPLVDLMLTKRDCISIIEDAGLPLPLPSSCWMCPNMNNAEWRDVRDLYPKDFGAACELDEAIRAEDIASGGSGVWLHHSRLPLRDADLESDEGVTIARQCGLGLCMV